ncbi:hypothetical protein REC12_21430 [Desulfosporosinus sp. PR]|uniref:hypothetical protein n=1 Tax=Candidatus Desulfosporosinus nitrosoreducens TaxID=3401928 RepID=UPI0027FB8470|nr:hypothetical protein [Desulfosporosinus sp. PR]MDQ7096161.1 hypothetical protein [Desulfosporosinus sp. PR]
MWPRRKVMLVAASGVPGIEGVRALLKELDLDYSEVDPALENFNPVPETSWWETPFNDGYEAANPFTEGILWSDVDQDLWSAQVLAQKIPLQSVTSFLHNVLEDEIVISLPAETAFMGDCPLTGHILKAAGFEPSILWQTTEGTWKCERGLGLIWILPETWLAEFTAEHTMGRAAKTGANARWELREWGIDFYSGDGKTYIGHLPRWPNLAEEPSAADAIAQCLNLGVSWLDVKSALASVWTESIMTDNLRWNNHGFGWNTGACGEKLPSEAVDHVEDWWNC